MSPSQTRSSEFWNQLVEKRALSPAMVERHQQSMRDTPWVPLGKILIREGILSVRQVMGLVAMQVAEPHMRIGDLAVREGLCAPEDIALCLDLQAASSPGPIQLVLKDENISENSLINALVGYIHFLEGQLEQHESATADEVCFA